ncbi:MAG: hypothetical protein KDA81_14700 [Planctomycetaceae bacterium]|nr:hypothetical protein [Planctomycetaceae bacterium]
MTTQVVTKASQMPPPDMFSVKTPFELLRVTIAVNVPPFSLIVACE